MRLFGEAPPHAIFLRDDELVKFGNAGDLFVARAIGFDDARRGRNCARLGLARKDGRVMPRETYHYRGKLLIKMERKGGAFVYDVMNRESDNVIASGFDLLSHTEEVVIDGIENTSRRRKKGQR